MVFGSWKSMVPGVELADPKGDRKLASRAGQYQISDSALYQADGSYLPFSAVTEVARDKGSVHVTGCCIGAVTVERVVVTTAAGRKAFAFDSVKAANAAAERIRRGAGLDK